MLLQPCAALLQFNTELGKRAINVHSHLNDHPTKQLIRKKAYVLFYETGIAETSYTQIANASGLGRPLIQHHFPQKRLFCLDLIEDMTALCIDQILDLSKTENHDRTSQPYAQSLRALQLYLNLLCHDDSMRRLTIGILADRNLSENVIDTNVQTAVPSLERSFPVKRAKKMVPALEVCYGMLYRELADGKEPDCEKLTVECVALYRVLAENAHYRGTCKELRSFLLNGDVVESMVLSVIAGLFGDLFQPSILFNDRAVFIRSLHLPASIRLQPSREGTV